MTDSIGRDAGVQVDQNGKVTYLFEGEIVAEGLTIDGSSFGLGGTVSDKNRVRWQRENGETIASITAALDARRITPPFPSRLLADVTTPEGDEFEQRLILDGAGKSDFVQGPGLSIYGPYGFLFGLGPYQYQQWDIPLGLDLPGFRIPLGAIGGGPGVAFTSWAQGEAPNPSTQRIFVSEAGGQNTGVAGFGFYVLSID